MGRGGHNALPAALHVARGSYRRDRHSGQAGLPADRVPRPPKGLSEAERAVWAELARQVNVLGTYSAATFTSFRLMVKVVAMVDTAAADMPATALVRLTQVASGLLGRFGLDPATAAKVPRLPQASDDDDELSEFDRGGM